MAEPGIPVVIDSGAQEWRVGFAHERSPRVRFIPSIQDLDDTEVIRNGLILEFKGTRRAVNYFAKHMGESLSQMGIDSASAQILLSVPQKMSENYREQLTEMLFEGFNFQSVFYVSQPLLAAYSSGYSDCLVVDSGYSKTGILAVRNLYPLPESERVLPLGGRSIDRYLRHLSSNKLDAYNESDLHYIKANYCSVMSRLPQSGDAPRTTVKMPDGHRLVLGEELRLSPEMLFNPSLGGLPDVMPIDKAAIQSALSLEDNDPYAVLETVVLAGGNVLFPGTASRVQLGIATRTVPRINRRVVMHRNTTEAVWIGGTIIASTQTYPKVCITRQAYRELGSRIAAERWL